MTGLVLDASVASAWCFEDEATEATDALLDRVAAEGATAPGLWHLEVANVLLLAQRRERMSEAAAVRFVRLLGQLPIDIDVQPAPIEELVNLGLRHALTSYDAAYLWLAEQRGFALATLDSRLADAARLAGVDVLP